MRPLGRWSFHGSWSQFPGECLLEALLPVCFLLLFLW